MFYTSQLSVARCGPGDDRLEVHHRDDHVVIVVADGAGGTAHSRDAAKTVLEVVRARIQEANVDPVNVLMACDRVLTAKRLAAETTAVIAVVDDSGIRGASVGDSEAWVVSAQDHVDLTARQVRKPLIGSGLAVPRRFAAGPLVGTLLVATDGLFKYGAVAVICRLAGGDVLDEVPAKLIDSVRLRSGALQDDASVVVCRRRS